MEIYPTKNQEKVVDEAFENWKASLTPMKKVSVTGRGIVDIIKQINLTKDDIDNVRAAFRTSHDIRLGKLPAGTGQQIDEIRAMCNMLDAVLIFYERVKDDWKDEPVISPDEV